MGRVTQLKQNLTMENDNAGLLISFLIRYPEILKIIYEPKQMVITFAFGIRTSLEDKQFNKFKNKVSDYINTVLYLNNQTAKIRDLSITSMHGISLVEFKRDLTTFEKNELNVLIELLKREYEEKLLVEDMGSVEEDVLWLHEEIINNFLLNLGGAASNDVPLVAFRENGRVFVFNKN